MKLARLEPVPQDFQMIPMFAVSQASCRWAESRIEGATVVLSNARSATRVRYAWGGSPVSALSDASGLPAGPFEAAIR